MKKDMELARRIRGERNVPHEVTSIDRKGRKLNLQNDGKDAPLSFKDALKKYQ